MSLLMDALKKAEQEKKEAAKRLKEAQAQAGEEMELAENDRIDPANPPEQEAAVAMPEKTGKDVVSEQPHETLSLAAIEFSDAGNKTNIQDAEEGTAADIENMEDITLENSDISIPELSIAEDNKKPEILEEPAQDPDQTFANNELGIQDSLHAELSFEDTVQTDEPDEFFDTISESRPVTSAISAAELAKDIGGGRDQPTPVAAQTVFTAIGTGREYEGIKWAIFLTLCLVVAVSLSVIYYFKIVPINIESSSPIVAKGIETDPASLPPVEIPEEILQGAVITDSTIEEFPVEPEGVEVLATAETGVIDEVSSQDDSEANPGTPVTIEESEGKITLTELIPDDVAKLLPALPGQETSDREVPRGLPQNIEVDTSAIKITRSKSRGEFDELINSAYLAYKNGNYNVAEGNYRNVLESRPENKDALLGLAAVKYIKGDIQGAYSHYHQVLKLYPHDRVARSTLINMQDGRNFEQSESAIKIMLQQEPESAFLYFTLGNIYASQSRWPDAQQAFFNAYRYESSNPDYAFNLAVSLDHIGQNKSALDYYNVALQLADNGVVNFNTATVLSRINSLSSKKDSTK